ncbi:MAG: oligosaccharide flippase family protein [Clostridia bacterium]|nr:oligosaccharide flippase family protein [Clostridia bacterium]
MATGILFNVVCNLIFVVVGYAIHYFFGAVMTPAEYGVMGSILTILDFEYLFLNNGVRQSLSKEISSGKYDTKNLIQKGILFQAGMMLVMCAVNVLGANLLGRLLQDASIPRYIRLASLMVLSNGSFVVTIGIAEGLRKFVSAATANLIYSLCKLSVVPYVLWIFRDPIVGAEMGYVTAGLIGIAAGCGLLYRNRAAMQNTARERIPFGKYVRSTLNFSVFFIIVSVVLSLDTLVVKGRTHESALAGYYTGAVNFAKVTYFILQAFFTILLPTLTRAYSEGRHQDVVDTASLMEQAALALVLPICAMISATGPSLLRCFYGKTYIRAADALGFLSFAHFSIGMTVMYAMMLSAMNDRKFTVWLSVITLAADVALVFPLTSNMSITGTALAGFIVTRGALMAITIYARMKLKKLGTPTKKNKGLFLLFFSSCFWLGLRVLLNRVVINNLFLLGGLYLVLYAALIALYHFTGLFNLKDFVRGLRK